MDDQQKPNDQPNEAPQATQIPVTFNDAENEPAPVVTEAPAPAPTAEPAPAEPVAADTTPAVDATESAVVVPETPGAETAAAVTSAQIKEDKKTSKILMILALIFALAAAGLAVWYFMFREDPADTAPTTTQSSQETTPADETPAVTLATTTFTSGTVEGGVISIEHPDSWGVENTSDVGEVTLNHTSIAAPNGYYLHIFDVDGIGGACDPDEETYTLVKKLSTASGSVFFNEYTGEGIEQVLRIEEYTDQTDSTHAALTEGESNVGICENIPMYTSVGGIFVVISTQSDKGTLSSDVAYGDIADDAEFVAMLQSLKYGE